MELCFFTTSSSSTTYCCAGLSFYASDMSSLEINYLDLFSYLKGTHDEEKKKFPNHFIALQCWNEFQGERKNIYNAFVREKNIYFRKKLAKMSISKIEHLETFLQEI